MSRRVVWRHSKHFEHARVEDHHPDRVEEHQPAHGSVTRNDVWTVTLQGAAPDQETAVKRVSALLHMAADPERLDILTEVVKEWVLADDKYGADHDAMEHDNSELAIVAAYLAHPVPDRLGAPEWGRDLAVRHRRLDQLVIAVQLLLSEIRRLKRKGQGVAGG